MDRRASLDAAAASAGWLDLYLGYYSTSDVTGATEYLKLVGLPRPVAGLFTAMFEGGDVSIARADGGLRYKAHGNLVDVTMTFSFASRADNTFPDGTVVTFEPAEVTATGIAVEAAECSAKPHILPYTMKMTAPVDGVIRQTITAGPVVTGNPVVVTRTLTLKDPPRGWF